MTIQKKFANTLTAILASLLLLLLVGCGGSDNTNAGNNGGNNGGVTPGGSNSGGSGGSGGGGNGVGSPNQNQFLYAGSLSTGIQAFKIDASSGALTLLSGAPFTSGLAPNSLAVDPANRFLYASISQQPAERGANCSNAKAQLDSYTIGNDGTLTALEQLTLDAYCPTEVLMHPGGKYVYVLTQDTVLSAGQVHTFSIGSDGKLTPVSGSPFALSFSPGRAVISSDGRFIYAVSYAAQGGLRVLATSSSGTVTELQALPFGTGAYVTDLALASNGNFLVTTPAADSTDRTVHVFTVDRGSGRIASKNTASAQQLVGVASVVADRSGQYLLFSLSSGGINVFRIASSGDLTFVATGANSARTMDLAMDTSNRFVYAQNNNNSISTFSFDAGSGALTPISGPPFSSPSQLVSPVVVKK